MLEPASVDEELAWGHVQAQVMAETAEGEVGAVSGKTWMVATNSSQVQKQVPWH